MTVPQMCFDNAETCYQCDADSLVHVSCLAMSLEHFSTTFGR